jgi:hypothetical protein
LLSSTPRYVIYTASFGRKVCKDNRKFDGVRMMCFSDLHPPFPWEWIPVEPGNPDLNRSAKVYKLLPWLFLGEWDESLWIDCNFKLLKIPRPISDIGFHQHRSRNCIFKEASVCISKKKDSMEVIESQMLRYINFPRDIGLWEGGFIYRKNTHRIKAFCYDWMREIDLGSRRDQLSLPVVLSKHGIIPENLGKGGKHSIWVR